MNEPAVVRFLAIDVMGWVEKRRPTDTWNGAGENIFHDWYKNAEEYIMRTRDFDPIHEIAHAFMVVEKMLEMELVDSFDVNFDKGEAWLAIFTTNPLDFIEGFAEKLPKAISIAAVRALATDEQIASWL